MIAARSILRADAITFEAMIAPITAERFLEHVRAVLKEDPVPGVMAAWRRAHRELLQEAPHLAEVSTEELFDAFFEEMVLPPRAGIGNDAARVAPLMKI